MAAEMQTPLTVEAYDRLDAEFNELVNVVRPEISRKIQEAREEGDLKENGGYHAAREEQGRVEARLSKLEQLLKSAILTNGSDFNFIDDLRKYRLEALELCKEVLLYEAILDYSNLDEEVDSNLDETHVDALADIDSEIDDENQDSLDKDMYNLKHVQYQRAMSRLHRIIETSSLNESDHEFFKAQIDRTIFTLSEADRLNSSFVLLVLIPQIRDSIIDQKEVKSAQNPDEVNEDTFQIAKLIFTQVLKVLFPNGDDSKVEPVLDDLLSLSVGESLESFIGAGNLDNELEILCSRRESLNRALIQLTVTRAIILSQGRVSGDSSLETLDSEFLALRLQLQVIKEQISYCLTRSQIPSNDSVRDLSEVRLGTVITIQLGEKKMEFLLGSAQMADNTELTVYSPDSPMGNAIMGAKIGETVSYTAPTGKLLTVKIVAVSHFEG